MAEGYEAYAVGGCVRDSLLSRIPHDWDITTNAKPEEVKKLFRRTIDTGIKHGTVTIMLGAEGYEVTTYRIDGEYEDSRHPKNVVFTTELAEDLKRRDFTINAMAYNEKAGIVDLFGGQEDLNDGIVRAVGNPKERFTEDALRIMRAVRFAAQLGYDVDEETSRAARKLAPNLKNISAERVREELVKLLVSPHPEFIRKAWELGITRQILPEFDVTMETAQNTPHHMYSVGEHIIHSICNISSEGFGDNELMCLRVGMLLHDIGKPASRTTDINGRDHFYGHAEVGVKIADNILRRLKFDNKSRTTILDIVKYHDVRPRLTYPGVRKTINKVGLDSFYLLFPVQQADIFSQSEYDREGKLERAGKLHEMYDRIIENADPLFVKDLAVNGNDLMQAGFEKGKLLGEVLQYLLTLVLDSPEKNTREELMKHAENYRNDITE